jgi:hypothetical protein
MMYRKLFLISLLVLSISFMSGCNAYKAADKAVYGSYSADDEKQIALLKLKGGDSAGTADTLRRLADADPSDKELQYYAGLAILKNQGLDFISIGETTLDNASTTSDTRDFATLLSNSDVEEIADSIAYMGRADTTEANVQLNLGFAHTALAVSTYLQIFDANGDGDVVASEVTQERVNTWNAARAGLANNMTLASGYIVGNAFISGALNSTTFDDVEAADKTNLQNSVTDVTTNLHLGATDTAIVWNAATTPAEVAGWDN